MNSRERVMASLNHKQPDKVPFDLGATSVTGIHALALHKLRQAKGLPEKPIKVYEVFQQLGMVDLDDIEAFHIDVTGIIPYKNLVGAKNSELKSYANPFGIPALCARDFNVTKDNTTGRIYGYPQGDLSAKPSIMMPKDGYFFDNIERSPDTIDDEDLDPIKDFAESFGIISDEEARFYEAQANYLFNNTELGVIGTLAPAGFGDVAILPGADLKNPRGIRNMADWIMIHKINPEYIHRVYDYQLGIALKNLEIYSQAVGNKIQAVFMGGTDFGTQMSLMLSEKDFREFYFPYWKKANDWVHENTNWKTFYHSCGAVSELLDDFVEAGMDILNPVQCSAAGMDAAALKNKYKDQIVFWGGGIDTQNVLPFGTEEEIRQMVRNRIEIFGKNGGFIFNAVHNIQANVPVQNIVIMLDELEKCH